MIKVYSGLVHLNGNMLASLDFETSGRRPGYHEVIQIAVVPLDSDLKPRTDVRPFYMNVAPNHPERADPRSTAVHRLDINDLVLHAPSQAKVADLLVEWWERLDLPVGKCLVPLAHNWAFESSFLKAWLGVDLADQLFHSHARDAMSLALSMNDRAAFAGEPAPFNRVGLSSLCNRFQVHNSNPHDALCDALAEAEVYRAMIMMDLF
jgi:DNA polymerase III epsilon subunit-like protein